jgi:putative ABC transport system substrate-binding protein
VDVIVFPVTGGQFNSRRAEIITLAASAGMPTVYDRRDAVAEGGLIGIGGDQTVIWRRAAHFVDQILKGATPSVLPVEQVDAIVLAVNAGTAAAQGIPVPQSILDRAEVLP